MAKQLPKQVQNTIVWIKSNTLVVGYAAIVVCVPVGAYFAADWFGEGVRLEADKKAKAHASLNSALVAKVDLPLPGGELVPLDGLPTEATVEEFKAILGNAEGDANAVFAAALERNQGAASSPKHVPVVPASVFPAYARNTFADVDGIRGKYVKALNAAYASLLKSVDAGAPPSDATVSAAITDAEQRFVKEKGSVPREKLSAEDKATLEKQLITARIQACNEVAKGISFYADMSAFSVPTEEDPAIVGLFKDLKDLDTQDRMLFDLQWRLWITSDILNAFASANGKDGSVITDPVKRVVQVTVLPMAMAATAAPSGEASAMGAEPGADASAAVPPADGTAPAPDAAAPAVASAVLGKPIVDNHVDATRDYSKRFTGRVSNPVYDVRLAEVTFVAETSRLPLVFDRLAAQNFMTVTDVRLTPVDQHSAARMGFLYGLQPVCEVKATVETIWLRAWTAEFMPATIRTALGIQSATGGTDPASADPAAAGASGL